MARESVAEKVEASKRHRAAKAQASIAGDDAEKTAMLHDGGHSGKTLCESTFLFLWRFLEIDCPHGAIQCLPTTLTAVAASPKEQVQALMSVYLKGTGDDGLVLDQKVFDKKWADLLDDGEIWRQAEADTLMKKTVGLTKAKAVNKAAAKSGENLSDDGPRGQGVLERVRAALAIEEFFQSDQSSRLSLKMDHMGIETKVSRDSARELLKHYNHHLGAHADQGKKCFGLCSSDKKSDFDNLWDAMYPSDEGILREKLLNLCVRLERKDLQTNRLENEPIVPATAAAPASTAAVALLEQLLSMGYASVRCERALAVTGGDVAAARQFIVANATKPDEFWTLDGFEDFGASAELATGFVFDQHVKCFSAPGFGSLAHQIEIIFHKLDKDKDGQLGREEVANMANQLLPCGKSLTTKKVDKLFEKLDSDKSGGVDFNEFKKYWEDHYYSSAQQIKQKERILDNLSQGEEDLFHESSRHKWNWDVHLHRAMCGVFTFCYMPITQSALGMLIPRRFGGETYVMADMSTEYMSGHHLFLFALAVTYSIFLCLMIPWAFYGNLRAETVHVEKLERAWSQYVVDGIKQWTAVEKQDPSKTENGWNSASVQKERALLHRKMVNEKEVMAIVRGQSLDEMRFSLLSNKYRSGINSWWFAWELLRKVIINVLFVLGQNKSYNFGWKLFVFIVLVGSMMLNMCVQPYYSKNDDRLEAIALSALLLVLYVANSLDSLEMAWVQWMIFVSLCLVITAFFTTKHDINKYFTNEMKVYVAADWMRTRRQKFASVCCKPFSACFCYPCRKCGTTVEVKVARNVKPVHKVKYEVIIWTCKANVPLPWIHDIHSSARGGDGTEDDGDLRRERSATGTHDLDYNKNLGQFADIGCKSPGTDANVFLKIKGAKNGEARETDYYHLNHTMHDDFEAGSKDVFRVTADDVGTMTNIELGHDGANFLPILHCCRRGSKGGLEGRETWLVSKVFVKHLTSMQEMILEPCAIVADMKTLPSSPNPLPVSNVLQTAASRPDVKLTKKIPARMVILEPQNWDHLDHDHDRTLSLLRDDASRDPDQSENAEMCSDPDAK